MKTPITAASLFLCLAFLSSCACAQHAPKWDSYAYDKWGFVLQLPTGAKSTDVPSQPAQQVRDLYLVDGLACVVEVVPVSGNALTSTYIEQTIQSEIREAAKLGPAKRWEQTSRQGDLMKGYTAAVVLKADDALQAAAADAIGGAAAVGCVAMAPIGDDSSPVLRISVFGPASREKDVATIGKGVAAFASKTKPPTLSPEPKPAPTPRPGPVAQPKPKPAPKPWPMLKAGQIELEGVVDSVSRDGKTLAMTVDTIKVVNQQPVRLTPPRPKKVLLKAKQDWLKQGAHIRLVGKNTGDGRVIPADAIEESTPPVGKLAPPVPPRLE